MSHVGTAVTHRHQIPGSSAFSLVALQGRFRPSASTQGIFNVPRLPASLTGHWWISLFMPPTDGTCGTSQPLIATGSLMDSFHNHVYSVTCDPLVNSALHKITEPCSGESVCPVLAVWGETRV